MSKKTITITKIISRYYDLTQADFFFNIQPKVNIFGEEIKYDREKYAFKNNAILETMISNNNPLSKNLRDYDSQNKNINICNNHNRNYNNNIYDDDENKDKETEMEKLIITTTI